MVDGTTTTPTAPAAAPAPAPAPVTAPAATIPPPAVVETPSIAGGAKETLAPAPTKDEQAAYLATKGLKPEDIEKLDEAGIKAKFDELKAAETKPKDVTAADIEVKWPEGASVDQEAADAFKGIIADANLSPSERAQKLVDMYASLSQKTAQANLDLWFKTQADWQKEVKADKELGGENFVNVGATIAKALTQFGGEHETDIRKAFDMTGAGNHPALVRVFYRMSKALVEGGPVSGNAPGAGNKSAAEILYGQTPS